MEQIIKHTLQTIEKEQGIRMLWACETGSRAWGFPSPDSDYDVRFIYAAPLDWHLSLKTQKDSYEMPVKDDLDITGWEIGKCMSLLWKSNMALLERVQSPIIYAEAPGFIQEFMVLAREFFSPIAAMHHYQSMAKKYLDACSNGSEVKLKSYMYAIRTAICASWIRETGEMPHIELHKMFGLLTDGVRQMIEELILLKATKNESYVHARQPELDVFLKHSLASNGAVASQLPSARNKSMDKLDDYYRKVVKA